MSAITGGANSNSEWICNKPLRIAFAKEMFDVGIFCVYHDSNDQMDSASKLMLRFRTRSEFKFNPKNLNNPLCPDSLET